MTRLSIALCCGLLPYTSADAQVVYNEDLQPLSISGLEIAGVPYNVSFLYEGSFNSHFTDFNDPSPQPTFWGDEAGASAAVIAIAAALNAEGALPTTDTFLNVPVSGGASPFGGDVVDAAYAEFLVGGTQYVGYSLNEAGIAFDPTGDVSGLATFVQVPEPASLTVLLLASLGFAMARRRRIG